MLDFKRLHRGLKRRVLWIIQGCPRIPPILEMTWPASNSNIAPVYTVPGGYTLRQYSKNDEEGYYRLLESAGMERCSLTYWNNHILPNGFFLIECDRSGDIVAACFASHHPTERHARAGNLGWLAVAPGHQGKKLGFVVSAAVTSRLIDSGYTNIYLETHDHRLPAIKTYLSMGWVPLLYSEEMHNRWQVICQQLGWAFEPDKWR